MKVLFIILFIILFTFCSLLLSCGEFEKLDDGRNSSLVPANVQDIFTNECAKSGCHAGSSPPEGMNLSEAYAYDRIVNVSSSEQPALMRVLAGQPDDSYLMMKVLGGPGISGDQMPADGPPYLTTAQVDTIRLWIANGALPR